MPDQHDARRRLLVALAVARARQDALARRTGEDDAGRAGDGGPAAPSEPRNAGGPAERPEPDDGAGPPHHDRD